MPFRKRQELTQMCSARMLEPHAEIDPDTGRGLFHLFDPHEAKLPDAAMFDLENLLKAKVNLKQVNTKVVAGDVFGLADTLNNITEEQVNNEVNNEQ